ncbi:ATP-dependent DNA helicase DinG [Halalkalibacterium halodurans]|uniref:ATP-dependent DNA helicase DinG n=1 Tax=Halalkalibacterium halodurans TaxID=86665 RepID=UPI002E1D7DA3|nr:ATP-dependent DNA helicase DinG [Halalkalibacterium halodurans]MED4123893.1 ATP-dependent DNA helicase DinG [Halalkalibacterium halodurans]
MNNRFVVIDIETTGQSVAQGDRIIEIGAVVIEDEEAVESFCTLVNPERSIPPFIEELTGISDEMVKGAPTFHQCIPELMSMLEGAVFVAHNVHFDLSFLQKLLEHEGYGPLLVPIIDTVELSRILLPTEESYKLSALTEQLGLEHENPHRADSDAKVTADLLLLLLQKLRQLPLMTLQQLELLSDSWISDMGPILRQLIEKKMHDHAREEEAFDIYRQLAIRKPVKMKPQEEEIITTTDTFQSFKDRITQEGGSLSKAFLTYEWRQGQLKMMEVVHEAFSNNEHVLIEAGTGTGKSLAYLLPAAYFAHMEKAPVVISTQTIPLQSQLLERDIPLLQKILPFPINVALLKGRNHYLSLWKFEQALARGCEQDSYDTILAKAAILVWLTETERGDREELNLPTGPGSFWATVESDGVSSLGKYDPWFSRCFYQRARTQAAKADLIITNHALLCTDMVQKNGLLPSFKQAVIDEAHHFEEVASDHLGKQTDYYSLYYFIQRLGYGDKEGLLDRMFQLAAKEDVKLTVDEEKVKTILQECQLELDELFRMLHRYVLQNRSSSKSDVGRLSYRYESFREQGTLWEAILESGMRVHLMMKEGIKKLQLVLTCFHDVYDQLSFFDQGLLTDAKGVIDRLQEEENNLYELLLESDPNAVYWIEIEPRGAKNATFLYSRPIEVGESLADRFFATKKSVVLTSATLSIKGSFDYQMERLGLHDFGVRTESIPSPFSYKEQARLLLPTDIPAIKDVSEEEYAQEVAIKIWRIADCSSGRILVLFTSYEMLKQVYQYVKDLSMDDSLALIGQGITSGSRAKLMKAFKLHEKAILFGTSSFWEGIDLPGNELRCLVIVRLPFAPPDQPLLKAKLDKAEEEGKNPFRHISLPQAIIRFKQGFGRLIRTSQDKGSVFVLDKRIATTRYGRAFLESLPDVPVYKGTLESLIEAHKEWM